MSITKTSIIIKNVPEFFVIDRERIKEEIRRQKNETISDDSNDDDACCMLS